MNNTPVFPPLSPSVVLGVAAHPDDLDFSASGTMAHFAAMGAQVHYLILTDGGKGTRDRSLTSAQLAHIREDEQREALRVVGGKDVQFLQHPDAELEITMDLKREIVQTIRRVKPDVVITMDPTVVYSATRGFINHPDHRAAGQATLDAVFPLARDHLIFPELLEQGYEPHVVPTLLLANFDTGNFRVDISDTIEQKMDALAAHKSQIAHIAETQQRMKEMAAKAGAAIGSTYAETFVRLDIGR